jgi:hypothetical protein
VVKLMRCYWFCLDSEGHQTPPLLTRALIDRLLSGQLSVFNLTYSDAYLGGAWVPICQVPVLDRTFRSCRRCSSLIQKIDGHRVMETPRQDYRSSAHEDGDFDEYHDSRIENGQEDASPESPTAVKGDIAVAEPDNEGQDDNESSVAGELCDSRAEDEDACRDDDQDAAHNEAAFAAANVTEGPSSGGEDEGIVADGVRIGLEPAGLMGAIVQVNEESPVPDRQDEVDGAVEGTTSSEDGGRIDVTPIKDDNETQPALPTPVELSSENMSASSLPTGKATDHLDELAADISQVADAPGDSPVSNYGDSDQIAALNELEMDISQVADAPEDSPVVIAGDSDQITALTIVEAGTVTNLVGEAASQLLEADALTSEIESELNNETRREESNLPVLTEETHSGPTVADEVTNEAEIVGVPDAVVAEEPHDNADASTRMSATATESPALPSKHDNQDSAESLVEITVSNDRATDDTGFVATEAPEHVTEPLLVLPVLPVPVLCEVTTAPSPNEVETVDAILTSSEVVPPETNNAGTSSDENEQSAPPQDSGGLDDLSVAVNPGSHEDHPLVPPANDVTQEDPVVSLVAETPSLEDRDDDHVEDHMGEHVNDDAEGPDHLDEHHSSHPSIHVETPTTGNSVPIVPTTPSAKSPRSVSASTTHGHKQVNPHGGPSHGPTTPHATGKSGKQGSGATANAGIVAAAAKASAKKKADKKANTNRW